MALSFDHIRISFWNVSGETVPRYGVIKLSGDASKNDATKVISLRAIKPDGDEGLYALNLDNEVIDSDYGEAIIPLSGFAWAKYTDTDPPETSLETEVGPVDSEWSMDTTGTGWLYGGLHDADNGRILVVKLSDGGGKLAQGRLLSPMDPATNSLTGATAFSFVRFVTGTPVAPQNIKNLVEETDSNGAIKPTNGVNRSKLVANEDAYVILAKINGEWNPVLICDVCPEDT